MDHHIFLSYSSKDAADMERIKAEFLRSNLTVWTMGNIAPGTPSWRRAIEKAIKGAGCLVGILSPDARESDWVLEELAYANLQEIPVFIVLVRGSEKDSIPFGYTSFQLTDVRNNFTKVPALISEIQKQLNTPHEDQSDTTPDTVRLLIEAVFKDLATPYGEDVIEDVFLAIEANHEWLRRYDQLVERLGKSIVNQLVGRYSRDITKFEVIRQVDAKRSKLTGSYSKLKPQTSH